MNTSRLCVFLLTGIAWGQGPEPSADCTQRVTVEVFTPDGEPANAQIELDAVIPRQPVGLKNLEHGLATALPCGSYKLRVTPRAHSGWGTYQALILVGRAYPEYRRIMLNSDPKNIVDYGINVPKAHVVVQIASPAWRSRALSVRAVALADRTSYNAVDAKVEGGRADLTRIAPGVYAVLLLDGFKIVEAQTVTVALALEPTAVVFGKQAFAD